jgi:hypothetical protein
MDGLTVLVEAKKEYLAQLCCVMCTHLITVFEQMYEEAAKISKGKQVLVQFQKLLKEVPNWNNHMINQHVESMSNSCAWFNDLLAAVFVSYVKILSSVRINSDNKKISVKLPANDVFIHGCFTNAAKDLYKDPYAYHEEMSAVERDTLLTHRFVTCIENTVKQMIPIQEILKTYISSRDDVTMNTQAEEPEEPELSEQFPEEPESEAAPEAAPGGEAAPEGAPGGASPPEGAPAPAVAETETKSINVNGNTQPAQEDDGVLFPDAREHN